MIIVKDSSVRFKRFTPEMIALLPIVALAFAKHAPGKEIVITSANDGTHKTDSYHYTDYAYDFRSHDLTAAQKNAILVELKARLAGQGYDVLLEGVGTDMEHFHIEYNARANR